MHRDAVTVLKMKLAVAPRRTEWQSFRKTGIWMHGVEPSDTGAGITVGIKP